MKRRRERYRRAWLVLAWAAGLFVGGEVLLSLVMEFWQPAWRDREDGMKLGRVDERLKEESGRPLILVLGSSRVGTSIRPDVWRESECRQSLVFNAGVRGAGPMTQLLWLERLLADGVQPDWVILEYWPPATVREET